MSRAGDLLMLNLIFLAACIPVVTIGAASSALYSVCFRFGTDQEGKIFRSFFHAFREDFKRSTALWLIVALCTAAAGINSYVFYCFSSPLRWACVIFAILLVLILLIHAYVFPLVSQFGSGVLPTFKNAIILSLGFLPKSVMIAFFNVFPLGMLLLDPYGFLQMGFLWVALYFATAAYVNSIFLRKIFAPFLEEELSNEEVPQ